MRFLLIDADAAYRQVLRYHLSAAWPDARIDEYAAEAESLTDALDSEGIDPADYDIVLLGFPRERDRGRAWLADLVAGGNRRPVIVFADPSDEFLAVDSLRAGASSYFPKDRVRHARLVATINDALEIPMSRLVATPTSVASVRLKPPYEIVRELHATAVSSVYLAKSPGTGTDVALKVIRYVPDAGGENLFDRFLQEYEIIAALHHPNVVRIIDLGVADDHAFLAMEYLAAGSLAERLNSSLPPAVAVATTTQIASALVSVHGAGILHRDLKPANVMYRADGSVALIDFGLAKDTQLALALTGSGQIFGTPYYMSPEQGHAGPVDQRSDLYSLGCVFYEMLTARRPFTAASAMGVIYKHAHAARPVLPDELSRYQPVLDRLIAADPADRYASAAVLLESLAALG